MNVALLTWGRERLKYLTPRNGYTDLLVAP